MKLTDAHVSDNRLNELIDFFSYWDGGIDQDNTTALIELKQRRAEDRAKAGNNAD